MTIPREPAKPQVRNHIAGQCMTGRYELGGCSSPPSDTPSDTPSRTVVMSRDIVHIPAASAQPAKAKVWLRGPDEDAYGAIYLWQDRAAYENFQAGSASSTSSQ